MGLDTIELVIAIEEEFSIQIADADAPKLAVLGDMHEYIIRALREQGDVPDEGMVWERLRTVVVAQLGVRPSDVTRAANIVHDLAAD